MAKTITQLTVTIPDGAPAGSILSIPVQGRAETIKARVPMGLGPGATLVLTRQEGMDEWEVDDASAGELAPQASVPTLPVVPGAVVGLDLSCSGQPDIVVAGPDMDMDGVPDALQEGGALGGLLTPEVQLLAPVMATDQPPREQAREQDFAPPQPDPSLVPQGPVAYTVRLETTVGCIDLIIRPDWAPHGARRFLELAQGGDLDGLSFYRTVKGCLAQFGLPAKQQWTPLPDDPPTGVPFLLGALCFAAAGRNSRKSTLFICIGDMSHCFGQKSWETPIGAVAECSLDALDRIETCYGDIAECEGSGPDTGRLSVEGDAYLRANFPRLTYILKATPLDWPPGANNAPKAVEETPSQPPASVQSARSAEAALAVAQAARAQAEQAAQAARAAEEAALQAEAVAAAAQEAEQKQQEAISAVFPAPSGGPPAPADDHAGPGGAPATALAGTASAAGASTDSGGQPRAAASGSVPIDVEVEVMPRPVATAVGTARDVAVEVFGSPPRPNVANRQQSWKAFSSGVLSSPQPQPSPRPWNGNGAVASAAPPALYNGTGHHVGPAPGQAPLQQSASFPSGGLQSPLPRVASFDMQAEVQKLRQAQPYGNLPLAGPAPASSSMSVPPGPYMQPLGSAPTLTGAAPALTPPLGLVAPAPLGSTPSVGPHLGSPQRPAGAGMPNPFGPQGAGGCCAPQLGLGPQALFQPMAAPGGLPLASQVAAAALAGPPSPMGSGLNPLLSAQLTGPPSPMHAPLSAAWTQR